MLTYKLNVLILILTVGGSMFFLFLLNRFWPSHKRRDHNDLIGWQLGILGTTYAVILGFMLYTVWTNYGAADLNTDLEANSLRNLYRIADGLPETQRVRLQQESREYADAVITYDWPDMNKGQLPSKSHVINQDMWKTVLSVKLATPSEILAEDHAITELSDLTAHRRTRLLQSQARIPGILWCVLTVGGVVTISSACMFGSANSGLHTFQVFGFSLLISLCLLAVADINRPFRGSVHISNYAFVRAQQNMNEDGAP
jgi:hypothetical protein